MTEAGAGRGTANDATVKVDTEQGIPSERPAGIPDHYVWDPELGPIEEHTGKPRGAWREPKKGKP